MFEKEKIYIAGPECFYSDGVIRLAAMKQLALSRGFGVTLPNDHPLDMENPDRQKRADSIFADLKKIMLETTVVMADLEAYRGSEPDSGTIYELGMAYGKGARCYAYTRDKRPLAFKDQKYVLKDGKVYDEHGTPAPYKDLPFCPSIIGSTKVVEGDFDDCLKMLMVDIEEEKKAEGLRGAQVERKVQESLESEGLEEKAVKSQCEKKEQPVVYLAGPERYAEDAKAIYEKMQKLCEAHGLKALTPVSWAEGVKKMETDCAYTAAANQFDSWQQQVRNCDAVIANLNNYRGYECSNDVAFECGMGFQLGKKLFGYMDDARPAKEKIPGVNTDAGYKDMTGADIEDFDYPLNLMFSSSMDIMEGKFEDIIGKVAEKLCK